RGDWVPFTFELEPIRPTLATLNLAVSEDPTGSTLISSSPILTGHIAAANELREVRVEFDYDEDGVVDASTTVDMFGEFTITPTNLPYGAVKVAARVVGRVGVNTVIGVWSDELEFEHKLANPPIINELSVVDSKTA